MASDLTTRQAALLWRDYDLSMSDYRATVDAQRASGCCRSDIAPPGMLYSPLCEAYVMAPVAPRPPPVARPVQQRPRVAFTDSGWGRYDL